MIRYFSEDIKFAFKGRALNNRWLKSVAESEFRKLGNINIIFCSDPYILDINIKFLNHSYYTDIITFDYCEDNVISGDLFISIDTVRDNASYYGSDFSEELYRVMVHGILHLVGFNDHTPEEQKIMREKENYYLSRR